MPSRTSEFCAQWASVYTWHEHSLSKQSEMCFQFHSLRFGSGLISSFTSPLWYAALADCYISLLLFRLVVSCVQRTVRMNWYSQSFYVAQWSFRTKLLSLFHLPCKSITIKVTSCLSIIRHSCWYCFRRERGKAFILKVLISQVRYSMFTWEQLSHLAPPSGERGDFSLLSPGSALLFLWLFFFCFFTLPFTARSSP